MINIIDTFCDFVNVFKDRQELNVQEKTDLWEKDFISKYPELEEKCKNDYEESGYSWRDIAENMVFNRTQEDFPKMLEAHDNILKVLDGLEERVKKTFQIELEINVVMYCGLCNSAGWVTTYGGKRAILLGIDKIAELGWHTMEKIEPLIAHELCHVIHFEIRGEDDLDITIEKNRYNRGIWSIYEEGFAQFYQQKLSGNGADSRGTEWYENCVRNFSGLKKLYSEALYDGEKGTKDFFGDWFKVLGISDAGYFLGAELIKGLNLKHTIKEIAILEFQEIQREVMDFLKS